MARSAAESGFDEFVTARGPALLRTTWLLTGDEVRAAELAREVLGRALPHWRWVTEQGNGRYQELVWQILARTYLRQSGRLGRLRTARGAPRRAGEVSPAPAPARTLEALGRLPARQRLVLVLEDFDGLTAEQTADLLDTSVHAVRAAHARALQAVLDVVVRGSDADVPERAGV